MRKYSRLSALIVALALPVTATGCVALAIGGAAAGVAGIAYTTGDLEATIAAPLDEVWSATQEANQELGFAVKTRAKDQLGARLESTQARGDDVKIHLESLGEKTTKVSIRIGTFGNEQQSRLILRRIQENL